MSTDPLVAALRTAVLEAVRARDTEAASALRTALSAVANAEAVEVAEGATTHGSEHVAGAVVGVGAAEAPRRELSPQEVRAIVEGEVRERLEAADEADRLAAAAYAERLRREARALQVVLGTT